MYSFINALARGETSLARKYAAGDTDTADAFKRIYGNALNGGRGGIKDIIARLQEQYGGAKVKEGEVAPGVEESVKAADADPDKKSDQITMSKSLLERMLGDNSLAKTVEDAIRGFMDTARTSGAGMSGSYTQISLNITVTTVRYTEIQRSEQTGDVLSASELQTSLQDSIQEMIQRFFGQSAQDNEGEGEADAEAKKDSGKSTLPAKWNSGSIGSWSMEFFYASLSVESWSANGSSTAGGSSASASSFEFSASSFRAFGTAASFQVPRMLSEHSANGGADMATMLDDFLSQFGLSGSGYRETSEGFFFKASQSRNLIAELMELYGDRIGGATSGEEAYNADTAAEAETVGEPAEVAAAS